MTKVKCYSVRLQSLESISEKAYKATAFDGTTAIIPKSQVFGQDYDVQKSDAWWISAWILEQKELQFSSKKESYFDKELSHGSNEGIEIERHVPEEIDVVEVEPISDLMKSKTIKKVIGYRLNEQFYTYGEPNTWDKLRASLSPMQFPYLILLNPSTNEIKLWQYQDTGSLDLSQKQLKEIEGITYKYIQEEGRGYKTDNAISSKLYSKNRKKLDLVDLKEISTIEQLEAIKNGFNVLIQHISLVPNVEAVTVEIPIDRISPSELKIGQEVCLMENDQIEELGVVQSGVKIEGDGLSKLEYYHNSQIEMFAPSIYNYKVSGIKWESNDDHKTGTDIGGKYLAAKVDNRWLKVCHLGNGFGDGRYTLRFRDNGTLLVR